MAEIDAIIADWTRPYTSAEILSRLHESGVPAGLVYEPEDMLNDPHFAARESLATVKDERHGELVMQGVVPKFVDTPSDIRWPGQALGADTDAVLTDLLGLDGVRIAQLRSEGVI
jgi:crotonobetainyl-CoA:carnitine CoA-transferase CaiB-like acyl-CoA transferase